MIKISFSSPFGSELGLSSTSKIVEIAIKMSTIVSYQLLLTIRWKNLRIQFWFEKRNKERPIILMFLSLFSDLSISSIFFTFAMDMFLEEAASMIAVFYSSLVVRVFLPAAEKFTLSFFMYLLSRYGLYSKGMMSAILRIAWSDKIIVLLRFS